MGNSLGKDHWKLGYRLATTNPDDSLVSMLDSVSARGEIYQGRWTAPWLLSGWESDIWITTNGEKTRATSEGRFLGSVNVHWSVRLPNGCCLTDTKYSRLLNSCKKISFLYRQGYGFSRPPAIRVWDDFNGFLLRVCYWLVLEEEYFFPEKHGLLLFDQGGISKLTNLIACGGWCGAHRITERFMAELHHEVFASPCPPELMVAPFKWPQEKLHIAIRWLESNNGYQRKSVRAHEMENESRIANHVIEKFLFCSVSSARIHDRFNAALRQFEGNTPFHPLFVSHSIRTEFPSHRTSTIDEVISKGNSLTSIRSEVNKLNIIAKFRAYLPDEIPHWHGLESWLAVFNQEASAAKHGRTRFVPVNTLMAYLNESLRWVVKYGDDLVGFYLEVFSRCKNDFEKGTKVWGQVNNPFHMNRIFREIPCPDSLKNAGFSIKKFGVAKRIKNFDMLRASPTLHGMLEIHVGAVVVLLSLMKPFRDVELTDLPYNCILGSSESGFWINSKIAKHTLGEQTEYSGGRPIPAVVAKAVRQMQCLSSGLWKILGEDDKYRMSKLFYLTNPADWNVPKVMRRGSLNDYIDRFCDYVNLPVDELGRRWYIRVHEMRKWFLLMLFWSGRYDVLDAARWMAGHVDVQHIYAYIEREFPGGVGVLEAECVIDQLAQFDDGVGLSDNEVLGLGGLYREVLLHFNIVSLNVVPERQWHELVKVLFQHKYHLEPYSIVGSGGGIKYCIAIKQGDREA